MARIHYSPPSISLSWLTEEMSAHYPSHKQSKTLLEDLSKEYLKFWRLVLSFPERRVVAPGPITAVQRVHWSNHEAYYIDSQTYFNRFLLLELVWHGRLDVRGALDTVYAYKELYHESPPPAWQDITHIYNLRIAKLHVVN